MVEDLNDLVLSLGIVIDLALMLIQVDGGVFFCGQWELSLDYLSR